MKNKFLFFALLPALLAGEMPSEDQETIHVDPITNTPITVDPIKNTPIEVDPITNTPIEMPSLKESPKE